jgi:hypothetical protein
MDILQESKDGSKNVFNHVFQPQKKSTAEILKLNTVWVFISVPG